MLQILPSTTYTKLLEAVRLANLIFANAEFYQRLSALPSFTNTDATPTQVSELIQASPLRPTIIVRRRLNPLSSVNAEVVSGAPTVININKWHIGDGDDKRWAATLVHECVHCVDFSSDLDFTHAGNSRAGNEGSAPYSIQQLAKEMLKTM